MPITREKTLSIPISISLALILIGFFPRIHHWPLGFEINLFGIIALGVLYTIRFALKKNKTLKEILKTLMVLGWSSIVILGLFKMGYFPYLVSSTIVAGTIWLTLELSELLNKKQQHYKINPVLWVGIILMTLNVLFKIQFWPFSNILYLFGLLFSSIGFLVDHRINRN